MRASTGRGIVVPGTNRFGRRFALYGVAFVVGMLIVFPEVNQAVAATGTDPCAVLMPHGLATQLLKRFHGVRLPSYRDSSEIDVQGDKNGGGTGCLLVATGDFDGDGLEDVAVLLPSKKPGGSTILVAARRRPSGGWLIDELRSWGSGPRGFFVSTVAPGEYTTTEAVQGGSEPNEVTKFVARNPGVVSGLTEASGVAYFWDGSKWVHVWVSD
jgi:hypothetical protein